MVADRYGPTPKMGSLAWTAERLAIPPAGLIHAAVPAGTVLERGEGARAILMAVHALAGGHITGQRVRNVLFAWGVKTQDLPTGELINATLSTLAKNGSLTRMRRGIYTTTGKTLLIPPRPRAARMTIEQRVLIVMRSANGLGVRTVAEIAQATGRSVRAARNALGRLVMAGQVERVRWGRFAPVLMTDAGYKDELPRRLEATKRAHDEQQAQARALRLKAAAGLRDYHRVTARGFEPGFEPAVISRDAARALGLHRYYTGVPCWRSGHLSERWVSSTGCVACWHAKHLGAGL